MSRKQWLIAACMIVVSVIYAATLVTSFTPKPAEAAGCPGNFHMGRGEWCGYFFNQDVQFGGFVINGGGAQCWGGGEGIPFTINSSATFIAFMTKQLRGQGASPAQNKTGAEFIIETMLGKNGAAARKGPADVGGADYNTWVALIKAYGAAGQIDWNHTYVMNNNTLNSFYQNGPNDDAFFKSDGGCPGNNQTIRFRDANGKDLYEIRRECGNPLGAINGLVALQKPYALDTSLRPGTGTPAFTTGPNTGIVEPGNTYRLTPSVINSTKVDANPLNMEVENLNPANVKNAGVSAAGGYDTGHSYKVGGCSTGVAQCWHWDYGNGLPANKTSTESDGVTFTVTAATPQGTKVCFRVSISPSTDKAGSRLTKLAPPASYCFLVYTPVYPSVVGANGDIHAGGGICGLAMTNGSVKGYPGAISGTQYIVSASAAAGINNFGSDGSVTAPSDTLLNIGKTGGYGQVCREDLLSAAQAYYNAGIGGCVGGVGDFCTVGGVGNTDFDVTGKSGVYFFRPAAVVTVHGVISNKITLVALAGNVTISRAVTIGGGVYAPHDAPSLGIIAKGNIDIPAAVTRVDAYLFADGNIDTCVEANAACATPVLVINGFIMARNLEFHRRGLVTAKDAVVVEQVVLNPQIYLNPPKFFDATVDDVLLEGQGEKQPLF